MAVGLQILILLSGPLTNYSKTESRASGFRPSGVMGPMRAGWNVQSDQAGSAGEVKEIKDDMDKTMVRAEGEINIPLVDYGPRMMTGMASVNDDGTDGFHLRPLSNDIPGIAVVFHCLF